MSILGIKSTGDKMNLIASLWECFTLLLHIVLHVSYGAEKMHGGGGGGRCRQVCSRRRRG